MKQSALVLIFLFAKALTGASEVKICRRASETVVHRFNSCVGIAYKVRKIFKKLIYSSCEKSQVTGLTWAPSIITFKNRTTLRIRLWKNIEAISHRTDIVYSPTTKHDFVSVVSSSSDIGGVDNRSALIFDIKWCCGTIYKFVKVLCMKKHDSITNHSWCDKL